MAEITMIEAIRQAMDEELARDENVFIVGEDVGQRGGVFRATVGLFDKYGGERVIDSPLAEASIVGVGIGAVGDTALALAARPDVVAVCGTRAVDAPDRVPR